MDRLKQHKALFGLHSSPQQISENEATTQELPTCEPLPLENGMCLGRRALEDASDDASDCQKVSKVLRLLISEGISITPEVFLQSLEVTSNPEGNFH